MRRPVPQRNGTAPATRPYVRAGDSGWWRLRDNRLLLVCTANQVRSPMAAALLGHALEHQRVEAEIRSCGVAVVRTEPMAPAAVAALARRGIEAEHVSRPLEARLVAGADLVLTMTRAHLREVVATEPEAFARTFTLKECVRRARDTGPRLLTEPLGTWLERIADGRTPLTLLGDDLEDDVADPIGQGEAAFERCAAELEALVRLLVPLAWPMVAVALHGSGYGDRPEAAAPPLPPLRAVTPAATSTASPVVVPAPPGPSTPAPPAAPAARTLPPPTPPTPPTPPVTVTPPAPPAATTPAVCTPLPPPSPPPVTATITARPAAVNGSAAPAARARPAGTDGGFEIDTSVIARMVRDLVATGDAFDTGPAGPMAAGEPRDGTDWPAARAERWAATRLGGATVWLRGRSPQLVAQWAHAVANGVLAAGRASYAMTGATLPGGLPTVGAAQLLAEAGIVAVVTGGRTSLEEARQAHAAAGLPFVVVQLDDEPDPVRAVLEALGLGVRL